MDELEIELLGQTPPEILGLILQKVRDKAKITQIDMGRRLGYAGATVITHIETGVREVRLWEFLEFCRICEVAPDKVLELYLKRAPNPFVWPSGEDESMKGKKPQNQRRSRK